ncbi:hypothetical protein KQX54_009050 [Cotesia glomerata]|uniref:Uncharacterized protein n=1 Tax=Cotesia glomerata TaxID=32391 RepID=A0AAV7I850_COTGL|nr:hypothetical protein KQX54_009050 [Cotesia glomerata]
MALAPAAAASLDVCRARNYRFSERLAWSSSEAVQQKRNERLGNKVASRQAPRPLSERSSTSGQGVPECRSELERDSGRRLRRTQQNFKGLFDGFRCWHREILINPHYTPLVYYRAVSSRASLDYLASSLSLLPKRSLKL